MILKSWSLKKLLEAKVRADAKIAGITPAVLILSGRCDDSPP